MLPGASHRPNWWVPWRRCTDWTQWMLSRVLSRPARAAPRRRSWIPAPNAGMPPAAAICARRATGASRCPWLAQLRASRDGAVSGNLRLTKGTSLRQGEERRRRVRFAPGASTLRSTSSRRLCRRKRNRVRTQLPDCSLGRVGPAHCCAGPPSEPGRAAFTGSGSSKP